MTTQMTLIEDELDSIHTAWSKMLDYISFAPNMYALSAENRMVSPRVFQQMLKDTEPVKLEDGVVYVAGSNGHTEYLNDRYAAHLSRVLSGILAQRVRVVFCEGETNDN